MALARDDEPPQSHYLPDIKRLSGQRIEHERRRRGMSQTALGGKVGLGTTWVRQLESGHPKVRLDDHLICSDVLSISPLSIFIPLLFMFHGRHFPVHLLGGDLQRLEVMLLDFIVNWNVSNLRDLLRETSPGGGM